MNRAIVLYSGGLDSETCLAIALREHTVTIPLFFDYGQPHDLAIHGTTLRVVLPPWTVPMANVDKGRDPLRHGIPNTFVPGRNLVFLSYASAYAAANDCEIVYIGCNQLDYSGYPDCRAEFLGAFQAAANAALPDGLDVRAPLLNLTKAEIIKLGTGLGVDYSNTMSCYAPVGLKSCGECDACQLRLRGFAKAGLTDPVDYV